MEILPDAEELFSNTVTMTVLAFGCKKIYNSCVKILSCGNVNSAVFAARTTKSDFYHTV